MMFHPFAGRWLSRGKPGLQVGGGTLDGLLQRLFSGQISLFTGEITSSSGQVPGQDLPKPPRKGSVILALKTIPSLVSLQKRLLHDVRGIELAPEARIQMQTSQQTQITAKTLKRRFYRLHASLPF